MALVTLGPNFLATLYIDKVLTVPFGKRRLHQLLSTDENMVKRRVSSNTTMKMITIIPESRETFVLLGCIPDPLNFW